jgi:hypothetical protein
MKKKILLILLFFYNFNLVSLFSNNQIKTVNILMAMACGLVQAELMYELNKLNYSLEDSVNLKKTEKNVFIKSCEDCKNKIIYGGFALEMNKNLFEEIIKNIPYFLCKDNKAVSEQTTKIFGESFKIGFKAIDAYKGTVSISRKIQCMSKNIFGLAVLVGIIRGWLVKEVDSFIKEHTKNSKILGTVCSISNIFAQNMILDSIIYALSVGIALKIRRDIPEKERNNIVKNDVKDVQEIIKTVGAYFNISTGVFNIKNILN